MPALLLTIQYRIFDIYFRFISLRQKQNKFHFFFKQFISNRQPYNVVIIGAHDGISHDSIYDLIKFDQFRGLFIEPNKIYFDRLKQNYRNYENLIFKNIAIHSLEHTMELFFVLEKSLSKYPNWVNGLGSFNINHLLKNNISVEDIDSIHVKCESIMEVLSANKLILPILYLQIDTEGYDSEIIKSLDLGLISPKIIRFEYVNLDKVDIHYCILYLRKHYYFSFYDGNDIIAINTRGLFIPNFY